MKPLIVYAHPPGDCHCSMMLEETTKYLTKHKVKYDLLDLYKINYDPILHTDELYTSGNRKVSDQNKKFQAMVSSTNKLIFIHPVWWNSTPAILKGFFDKVFTAHFAFKFVKPKFSPIAIPVPLLRGKKAIVFMSGGTNKLLSLFFTGWRVRKVVQKDTLQFFGIKTKTYLMGSATQMTEKHKKLAPKMADSALKWLLK
ncbi:MAG: NAD(P)H-dependent oxidoreductase [Nanoarchaeota archaeon]|nr:NAD(P)H-dependent oxidoreductase [Nanoarchaeota archaeon]